MLGDAEVVGKRVDFFNVVDERMLEEFPIGRQAVGRQGLL